MNMEDRLKYTLQFVNDWLKFSEAKNAALVALVAVIMTKFSTGLWNEASGWIWWCYALGVWCITGGGVLSLMSFIPNLTFSWGTMTNRLDATENLFYFGHIAKHSATDYLNRLYAAEGSEQNPNKKLEADLAGQIVINSQIAMKKYRQFTRALSLALAGFLLVAIAYSAAAITEPKKCTTTDGAPLASPSAH